jgi:hypothetical protein
MSKALIGKEELKARIKAIQADNVFKPAGKQWADETVRLARQRVPNRNTRYSTGKLHDSIRRKTANKNKAVVEGRYTGYFVDAGTQGHGLNSRISRSARGGLTTGGQTRFAPKRRKGPGYPARPFRARSAQDALKKYPLSAEVVALWNRAA